MNFRIFRVLAYYFFDGRYKYFCLNNEFNSLVYKFKFRHQLITVCKDEDSTHSTIYHEKHSMTNSLILDYIAEQVHILNFL